MYTIDASIWVNSFDLGEMGHKESLEFLTLLSKREIRIYVPTLVVVEVGAAISRSKQDPDNAKAYTSALQEIENLQLISLDEKLAYQARNLAADQRLRGADAVYAAVAAQEKCTLVTTDKEQLERLKGIVITQTPKEAIVDLNKAEEE